MVPVQVVESLPPLASVPEMVNVTVPVLPGRAFQMADQRLVETFLSVSWYAASPGCLTVSVGVDPGPRRRRW